ncbi:MAG: C40 family peptidase [Firmicutes bacterium]|nr:C40 family peptidase [Bacillota bacterium]
MDALISADIAALYQEKDFDVVIDEGLYGMKCRILSEEEFLRGETWIKVDMEYGYQGYVPRTSLRNTTWEELMGPGESLLRVTRRYIDILSEPKVVSRILASVPRGGVIARAGEGFQSELPNGWMAVRMVSGEIGYTKTSFARAYREISRTVPKDEEAFRDDLIRDVFAYEGTAYRWGGKSPLGIDCSGLCSIVYLMNGVIIYRDAAIKEGFPLKNIPIDQIRKGDLIFFPGHVAMYLGGERKLYIHSTAKAGSDGVDINSLSETDPLFRKDLLESIEGIGSLFGDRR